jgi:5-methylcytosine-specific restriction protein B
VLEFAKEATAHPDQHFVCILDEMNLARVEQYFAEVLSKLEDRSPHHSGGYASSPLLEETLASQAKEYASIGLPPNLALVGTVNMDESTHGFSRKVLDRAFTIELSDIDLAQWGTSELPGAVFHELSQWPVSAWRPRATSLAELKGLTNVERSTVQEVIGVLTVVNSYLTQAQLQVGYRTRDEVALYVLHAHEIAGAFVTRTGVHANPVDLALNMKVLPRLVGGSGALKRALLQLLGWSFDGKPRDEIDNADDVLKLWEDAGRPAAIVSALYPFTAARLCLMWDRFSLEGFTSYWL